jgi:hypothetical protein
MKSLIALCVLLSFTTHSKNLDDIENDHQKKLESLQKKWEFQENECKMKYPLHNQVKHPHFSSYHDCIDDIEDEAADFEDQHDLLLCKSFKINCND